MNVPVRVGSEKRRIAIRFARTFHPYLVNSWKNAVAPGATGKPLDTVEFLESAYAKWMLYESKQRIATSFNELQRRIHREAMGEVLAVLTASARWHRNGAVIGFCQFRRTWCNNLVFDYLAVHPDLLRDRPPISGVGTALLFQLAQIASRLATGIVWAETTDTSALFYARLLGLRANSDLIRVNAAQFYARLALDCGGTKGELASVMPRARKELSIEEIWDLEDRCSALAGSASGAKSASPANSHAKAFERPENRKSAKIRRLKPARPTSPPLPLQVLRAV